jgi:hypothetical protein
MKATTPLRRPGRAIGALLDLAIVAGCALLSSPQEQAASGLQAIRGSFRDQGIATADRLDQDLILAAPAARSPTMRWPNGSAAKP